MHVVIYWGSGLYGRIDHVPIGQPAGRDGETLHIATEFVHVWFVPIVPTASYLLIDDPGRPRVCMRIPLSVRSVFVTYLRTFLLFLAIAAGFLSLASLGPITAEWGDRVAIQQGLFALGTAIGSVALLLSSLRRGRTSLARQEHLLRLLNQDPAVRNGRIRITSRRRLRYSRAALEADLGDVLRAAGRVTDGISGADGWGVTIVLTEGQSLAEWADRLIAALREWDLPSDTQLVIDPPGWAVGRPSWRRWVFQDDPDRPPEGFSARPDPGLLTGLVSESEPAPRDRWRWAGPLLLGLAVVLVVAGVRVSPPEAPVYAYLGSRDLKDGRYSRAADRYERAVGLAPDQAEWWFNLGQSHQRGCREDRAVSAFRRAVALRPREPNYRRALVDSEEQLAYQRQVAGDLDGAADLYQSVLSAEPHRALCWHNLGLIYRERATAAGTDEQWGKTIEAFRRASELKPRDMNYRRTWLNSKILFGNHKSEAGDDREAARLYREVLSEDRAYAGCWYNLGLSEERLEHREQAVEAYTRAAALEPPEPRYRQALLRAKGQLALSKLNENDFAGAVRLCRDILSENDELAYCWYNLGLAEERLGHCEKAVEAYARAVKLDPNDPDNRQGLTRTKIHLAYHKLKGTDLDGAVSLYREVLAENSELADCWHNLGSAEYRLGHWEKAVEAYAHVLALDPRDTEARKYLLGAMSRLARSKTTGSDREKEVPLFREALAVLRKLVATHPEVPDYQQDQAGVLNLLGNLLQEMGKRAEAESAYREALALRQKLADTFPKVPGYQNELADSRERLGWLLAGWGNRPEAHLAYRQAIAAREKLAASFPQNPGYRRALAGSYYRLGRFLDEDERFAAALEWFSRSVALLVSIGGPNPRDPAVREDLRNGYWRRAGTLDQLQRPAEAVPEWQKAIDLSDPADRPTPRCALVGSLARSGQHARAFVLAKEITADLKLKPESGYQLASACAVCAAAAKDDPSLKEQYAAMSIALLKWAVACDYEHADSIRADPDLDPLRDRDDFQQLLTDLDRRP